MSSLPSSASARNPTARLLVALGVVVLLLGDVWRLPHLLFSRHVVCREHGELVHDHEGSVQRAPGEGGASTPRAAPAGDVDHDHEHCSAFATASRSAAVISLPPASVQLAAAHGARELAFRELPAWHRAAVIGYAPKQGPPV